MSRLTTVLSCLLLGLLLLLVSYIDIFVVPVFHQAMHVWGAEFRMPGKVYFAIADHGNIYAALLLLGVVLGRWKFGEAGKSAFLIGACLLVTIVLALQSSLFVDLAIAIPAQ